jgi:hypothetical protein
MTFSEILPFLNQGFPVRRTMYDPVYVIFKQIPASIDDVSHLKSIPQQMKDLMLKFGVGVDYESQYIVYDFETGVGTYCTFDGEDINAQDWEVVYPDYNPYE